MSQLSNTLLDKFCGAVDNLLRRDRDEPTIGIILCKSKDKTIVEYALQGSQQPIGVSTYQLQSQLPPNFKNNLPTVEQLEMEFSTAIENMGNDSELFVVSPTEVETIDPEAWEVWQSLGDDAISGRLENPSVNHDRYLYGKDQ
jgi:YhcG PDDEXK nuclease domain